MGLTFCGKYWNSPFLGSNLLTRSRFPFGPQQWISSASAGNISFTFISKPNTTCFSPHACRPIFFCIIFYTQNMLTLSQPFSLMLLCTIVRKMRAIYPPTCASMVLPRPSTLTPLHVLARLALAPLGYVVYRVILVLTISSMHHLGWKRSSCNVLYKDTPLGHFRWIRGVPTTMVSTDAAPTTAVLWPPVADVTIGMLGIVSALPLGTAQSILISTGVCFSRVSSVMPANV